MATRQKSPLYLLIEGFSLANGNIHIYLIAVLIFIINLIGINSLPSLISVPLNIVLFFIELGFGLSIPLFLIQKKTNLSFIFQRTLKNTRRIIIPVFAAVIVLILSLSILFAFISPTGKISQTDFLSFIQGYNYLSILYSFTISVFASLFIFSPVYFSLENKGVINSYWQSIKFSLKNTGFMMLFVILYISYSFVLKFFPLDIFFGRILYVIVSQYFNLIMTSSALLFYQMRKKKN